MSDVVDIELPITRVTAFEDRAEVQREGEIELPKPSTVIREGDRVVLFAEERIIRRVERLFEVRLEFF